MTLEKWIAPSLAASVAGQGLIVWVWSAPSWPRALEWLLVSGLAALATGQAWRTRHHLHAHADMLLLMFGYGGLGMLAGWWVDAGFVAPLHCPAHMGLARGLTSWMTCLMVVFALPPCLAYSRCIAAVRSSPGRLALVIAIDIASMIAGMFAMGRWLGPALAAGLGERRAGMHVAMLGGMLAGMLAGMLFRDWLLERIPTRAPRAWPSPPGGMR